MRNFSEQSEIMTLYLSAAGTSRFVRFRLIFNSTVQFQSKIVDLHTTVIFRRHRRSQRQKSVETTRAYSMNA